MEEQERRFDKDLSIEEELYTEACIDAFISWLSTCEKATTFIINPRRVEQMELAYKMILHTFLNIGKKVRVTYGSNEFDQTVAWIKIEGKSVDAVDSKMFSMACEIADATDVYPLTNGNVRVELTFHNIFAAA